MTDEADAFARATRRSRRIRMISLGVIVSLPLMWALYHLFHARAVIAKHEEEYRQEQALSAGEVDELRAKVTQGRAEIAARRKQFAAEVTPAALHDAVATEARCPRRFSAPSRGAGDSYVKYGSIDGNYFGSMTFEITAPGAPIAPSLGGETYALDRADEALAKDEPTREILDRVREAVATPDDALFLVGKTQPGIVLGEGYEPGRFQGAAYLYSYTAHRIICTMDLDVANASDVKIEFSYQAGNELDRSMKAREAGSATLARDLDVQLRYAIATGMRATPN